MHVALTGASGFIGSVIARHLREAGHTVTGLVRSSSRTDHVAGYLDHVVVADQADESAWPGLLDGADAVIHNSVDWAALATGASPSTIGRICWVRFDCSTRPDRGSSCT